MFPLLVSCCFGRVSHFVSGYEQIHCFPAIIVVLVYCLIKGFCCSILLFLFFVAVAVCFLFKMKLEYFMCVLSFLLQDTRRDCLLVWILLSGSFCCFCDFCSFGFSSLARNKSKKEASMATKRQNSK